MPGLSNTLSQATQRSARHDHEKRALRSAAHQPPNCGYRYFGQGGTHVPVEPSSRGASTRMRTRGTLARHQLARVSGKRTCTHQQGGASPIRHGKAEKDGTPPRPSPGAHTACRDLGGLLQGLGFGVELAVVLAGGARVAAEEPAGRRHDTGRRRGAVRPLFCLASFVFLSWRESRSRSRSRHRGVCIWARHARWQDKGRDEARDRTASAHLSASLAAAGALAPSPSISWS